MDQAKVTYTFEKCLGRGGYGEVYLATSLRPGGLTKRVAVKVLRSGIARESEALRRLRDEGRVLAMLEHPSILAVHEMTRIDGRVALVTEYVEGIDLSKCCKRDFHLPARAVVGVLGEVAAALHTAAHTTSPETGKPLALIHRDIKPENIRLSKHGEVKLLDFGIARSTEMDREAQTVAGSLPFTPGYAAPECFNEGLQSAASDVYALGATGYRLLALERLFDGHDTGSHMMLVSNREGYDRFLEQRIGRMGADPRVAELIAAMLAFDPVARPTAAQVQQRCEVLADELDGLTHVRWARSTTFAETRPILDAELSGRTFEADVLVPTAPELPRSPVLTSAAPPVPAEISNSSIKPDTAPFLRPTSASPFLTPLDSLPIPSQGLETLPPGLLMDPVQADVETVVLDRPDLSGPLFQPVAVEAAKEPRGWGGFLVKLVVVAGAVVAAGAIVVLVAAGAVWLWVG